MVDGVRWHEQDLDAFLIHLCLCFCAVILSSFRFFFFICGSLTIQCHCDLCAH